MVFVQFKYRYFDTGYGSSPGGWAPVPPAGGMKLLVLEKIAGCRGRAPPLAAQARSQ